MQDVPRLGCSNAIERYLDGGSNKPMPLPTAYLNASRDFERYIEAMRTRTLIDSRNVHYTTTQSVFRAFRRRVSIADALMFADALPPVLRAIFVSDWNVDEPKLPFTSRELMTSEVRELRRDHNFAPETAITDVVDSLWSVVDRFEFERMLTKLPADAADFWKQSEQRM